MLMSAPSPDLILEIAAGAGEGRLICGVDEVGRGPLAGPVIAAAVILPVGGLPEALARQVTDSKLLSAATRERLEPEIRAAAVAVTLGWASAAEIDEINILQASLLAMRRAVLDLVVPFGAVLHHALIDGRHVPSGLPCAASAVVRGDRLSLSIAAASIVAKVCRDCEMVRLAEDCPGYGWERNAGYPTLAHRSALRRLGVTPHHRRSFAPVREQIALTS